nr:hypothetical protein [uncultured Achromobacter sp.]
MAKYQVVIPWSGVRAGQIVDLNEVHPSIEANVRKVGSESSAGTLSVDVRAIASEEAERIMAQAKLAVEGISSDARAEAERIVSAAQEEADRILQEAREEAGRIRAAATGAQSGNLTPATPGAADLNEKDRKALIVARLKELKVEHDGRKGADELATLLPDGDPLKPAAN